MGGPKPQRETQEQVQNRLRAQADNLRAIQEAVSDRTTSFARRFSPRQSIITGNVARAPLS